MTEHLPCLHDPQAPQEAPPDPASSQRWPFEPTASREFAPVDLLNNVGFLTAQLGAEISNRRWLDAYLLAAGTSQVLDDSLRRAGATLRLGARYLGHGQGHAGRMAATTSGLAATALDRARANLPGGRRIVSYRTTLTNLIDVLAPLALDPTAAPTAKALLGIDRGMAVWADLAVGLPPGLHDEVLRLPACFRSFDQHPEDMSALATSFAARWPDRARPLLVVGVRTSGSYLAPLCAAALRAMGYTHIGVATVRPGEPLLRHENAAVRNLARDYGAALLLDDPPVTGSSMARAAYQFHQAGLATSSIVLLIALCESQPQVPPALCDFPRVVLAGPDWHIVKSVQPDAIADALCGLLRPGIDLIRVAPRADTARVLEPVRSHVQASYTVELYDRASARTLTREVVAEGVGLGYFGRRALAVANALPDRVPQIYGFADGVLLRAGVPARSTLGAPWAGPAGAEQVADYVLARQRGLPAKADGSLRVAGQEPAWEVAATLLCACLGRLGMPLRIPLVDPIIRCLLTVADPTIIDGRMYPEYWHRANQDGTGDPLVTLVKENFAEGAFSNRELYSYDPIFDLAGAAVATGCPRFSARLREHYETKTAQPIPDERWLIYQLVQLWDAADSGRMPTQEVWRNSSDAVQRYLASAFLADVTADPDGPYCALDLDGVLETSALGFATTTQAGAIALRALLAHGYQPVLATGRNLDDVRDRCANYGLPGGVAEYGALVYQHSTGQVSELVTAQGLEDLERLRGELGRIPGVQVDPGHRLTLRAYRRSAGGRHGLARLSALETMTAAGVTGRVQMVPGDAQTDFLPAGVDKATGLRHLLGGLTGLTGPTRVPRPLALAVGDGPADARMLAIAGIGLAPGNAHRSLRRLGVTHVRRPYQAGVAAAVSALLGHKAGACAICRPPVLSRDTRRLVALLSVAEAGRAGMPRQLLRLALHSMDTRWHQ
jgi:hydroxymethylpyrimidine pyrophosphatase-like HAD family hydrolase